MTDFNMANYPAQFQGDRKTFVHPAQIFQAPAEVLNDAHLSREEKRAILASWASDACAVESEPTLRQIPSGAQVPLLDIVQALRRC